MMKTTLLTASLVPRPMRFIFYITFLALFLCFLPDGAPDPDNVQPNLFHEWKHVLDEWLSDLRPIDPNDIENGLHPLAMDYTHRAASSLALSTLISTIGCDVHLATVLEYAEHTAHSIGHWQSVLPVETQHALEHEFKSIFDCAIELIDICHKGLYTDIYSRPDLIEAICPLIREIFRGYCSIFYFLGGDLDTLISQFQIGFVSTLSFPKAVSYMGGILNMYFNI